jgi:malic enzyme
VGLGVIACRAKHVTDEMFLVAAQTLTAEVTEDDVKRGSIYPSLGHIREISTKIATAVCEVAYEQGPAVNPRPNDLAVFIKCYKILNSLTLYSIVWIGRFHALGETWNSTQLTNYTIVRDQLWHFNGEL